MKKRALRVLAWMMLFVMLFAPMGSATPASAQTTRNEIDSITSGYSKVLYLKEDMVQEDGSIVVSDEKWDCVVVARTALAKFVTLEGIEADEVVLESGAETILELNGSTVKKVTVVPAQVAVMDLNAILGLIASGMDIAEVTERVEASRKLQSGNDGAVPTLIVGEGTKVESLVANGGAKLKLGDGEVADVTVGSDDAGQMQVEINDYEGNLNIAQQKPAAEGSNILKVFLKNVQVEKLTVANAGASCCIENKKNSKIGHVEMEGASSLVLFADAETIAFGENADNADARLYGKTKDMTIDADNCTIALPSSAKIDNAFIKGNDAKIYGSGRLGYAEITGVGARVSTYGTTVFGDNDPTPVDYTGEIIRPSSPSTPSRPSNPSNPGAGIPAADQVTREEWIYALADVYGIEAANDGQFSYDDNPVAENAGLIETFVRNGFVTLEADEDNMVYFEPDEYASREFVAETVCAVLRISAADTVDVDWADKASVSNLAEAKYTVDNAIFELIDNSFKPTRGLTKDEKAAAVAILAMMDSALEINTPVAGDVEFVEGVTATQADFELDEEAGQFTIPVGRQRNAYEFEVGGVYVLESADGSAESVAVKVTEVKEENGVLTVKYEEPELYEVVDKIDIEGCTLEGGTITPAEGVTLVPAGDQEITASEDGDNTTLSAVANGVSGSGDLPSTLFDKFSYSINVANGVSVSGSFEVKKISYRFDVDASLFGGVDINEVLLTMETEMTAKVHGSLASLPDRYKRHKLCDVNIPIGLGFNASGEVFFVFDAEVGPSVEVVVNNKSGVQYSHGYITPINTTNLDVKITELEGSVKVGFAFEPAVEFVGVDVVSVGVEGGAGLDAAMDIRPIAGVLCGSIDVYPYLKIYARFGPSALDLEIDREVLHKGNAPDWLKKSWHCEIANGRFSVLDDCTRGAAYAGKVVSNDGLTPIAGAKVQVFKNGVLQDTQYTNSAGEYTGNRLSTGSFTFRFSAAGFEPQEKQWDIVSGTVNTIPLQILPKRATEDDEEVELFTCSGVINDALNGQGVDGVKITVESTALSSDMEAIVVYTNANGEYTFEAPKGEYCITASKDEYLDAQKYISLLEDTQGVSFSINPMNVDIADDDNIRIVLNWGERPYDIDSHLLTYTEDEIYHIAYYDKDNSFSNLDVDDVDSYGPETVTIVSAVTGSAYEGGYEQAPAGKYSYYVHNYSNRSLTEEDDSYHLAQSGAVVRVYIGNRLLYTISIPDTKEGTVWHVFDFTIDENGALTGFSLINEFEYMEEPRDVGMPDNYAVLSDAALGYCYEK